MNSSCNINHVLQIKLDEPNYLTFGHVIYSDGDERPLWESTLVTCLVEVDTTSHLSSAYLWVTPKSSCGIADDLYMTNFPNKTRVVFTRQRLRKPLRIFTRVSLIPYLAILDTLVSKEMKVKARWCVDGNYFGGVNPKSGVLPAVL